MQVVRSSQIKEFSRMSIFYILPSGAFGMEKGHECCGGHPEKHSEGDRCCMDEKMPKAKKKAAVKRSASSKKK